MGLKLKKYITARVREYWKVDPDKKKVVVSDLEHNELPSIYGFEDQVPVNIFAGKGQIDFSEIGAFLYRRGFCKSLQTGLRIRLIRRILPVLYIFRCIPGIGGQPAYGRLHISAKGAG